MEIILLKDVDKVGYKHEMVTVKDGYGRNYLIPQGMAIIANESNKKRLGELKRMEAAQAQKMIGEYQAIAEKLQGSVIKIGAKSGTSGKIFGSVTNVQIATALKEQLDIDVERRKVNLIEEVKMLGTYTAELDLHPEVETKVTFEVVAE